MHLCIYYRFRLTLSFNPFDLFSILTRRESKKRISWQVLWYLSFDKYLLSFVIDVPFPCLRFAV